MARAAGARAEAEAELGAELRREREESAALRERLQAQIDGLKSRHGTSPRRATTPLQAAA